MCLLNRASSLLSCLQDCAQAVPVLVWLPLTQNELRPFLNLCTVVGPISLWGEFPPFFFPWSKCHYPGVCQRAAVLTWDSAVAAKRAKHVSSFSGRLDAFSVGNIFLPLVTKGKVLSLDVSATGQAPTICCRNKGCILMLWQQGQHQCEVVTGSHSLAWISFFASCSADTLRWVPKLSLHRGILSLHISVSIMTLHKQVSLKYSSGKWIVAVVFQQHSPWSVEAYSVAEMLSYFGRICLLPTVCLGLLRVPVMGELLVLGAAILQELSSSCYLATVYEISGFKTSENFKQGFAEMGGFSLGVLMWGCRWRGLTLQWELSNICLASEEEVSFTPCYVCPLLHPAEGMEATKQACARPDVQSQGTHTLQSTAEALNKWLLYTKFKCCKLLCDCSTKGKMWESYRPSCIIS